MDNNDKLESDSFSEFLQYKNADTTLNQINKYK